MAESQQRGLTASQHKPVKAVQQPQAPQQFFQVSDPEELAKNMLRLYEQGTKALTRLLDEKRGGGPFSMGDEMSEAGKALGVIVKKWLEEPDNLAASQAKLGQDFVELWGRTFRRFLGEDVEPVVKPEPGDNRFQDAEWTKNPLFDFIKQAYLLVAHWAEDMIEGTKDVEHIEKRRALFYFEQLASALSPSNFPFTNPEVIRTTFSTNAENLVTGMTHLVEDLDRSGDLLKIRQTDASAFEVGKNLAVTPGKVVFQNDIIQLIQYSPATDTVYKTPLLVVPPWINKFYILDLTPPKSFIRWAVEQGFTVFLVSWVNPDKRLAGKTFEDYMREGVLTAVEVATRAAGVDKVNALGYCVGGTLLSSTLAYMAQTGDRRINSASFLTTQTDFSKAGDLLIFINDTQLKALEEMMAERGFLDGSRMANVFNMMRPRDLIWPYVVNNYLLGKKPFPFDLLFWNSDSTRMPPANHSFYLREFYQLNRLAKGELMLGGVKLDLSKVTIPVYHLAAKEDHIAPAPSVFLGAKLLGGPVRFVLAGSGHIAGVINPPAKPKYMHWTLENGKDVLKGMPTLDEWFAKAKEHTGSWWPDYKKWLTNFSGDQVPSRQPGEENFKALEDAPGSFVKAH